MDYTASCECEKPGFCERFSRDMPTGMHDVCRGVGVSPGVRAAYLKQWGRQKEQGYLPAGYRDMAINFAQAAAEFLKDGGTVVPEAEYDARMAACEACRAPKGFLQPNGQCSACGCFVRAKAVARSQTCPVGLWPLPGDE